MLRISDIAMDYTINAFFYAQGDFLPATSVAQVTEKNDDGLYEWTLHDFGETGDEEAERIVTSALRAYVPDEESLIEKFPLRAIEDEAGWYQSELVALYDCTGRRFTVRLYVRILPSNY